MNTRDVFGLDGTVALITGASGGFGAAIAMILARAGARVALVGRDRGKLRLVADEIGEHTLLVEGDVSRPGEAERIVQSVVETCGRLDILVNTAGGATVGGLLSLSDERWQQDIDLKLLGYMRMMRAAAPIMRAQRGGRIVNVLGLAGHEPYHLITAPSVVNAGLLALTKTAADELASDHILVNALNPNAAITGRGDRMIAELAAAQGARSDDVRSSLVEATPLGRLARPDDVAKAVLFYVSDLAPFITGTSLTIDGASHRAIA